MKTVSEDILKVLYERRKARAGEKKLSMIWPRPESWQASLIHILIQQFIIANKLQKKPSNVLSLLPPEVHP